MDLVYGNVEYTQLGRDLALSDDGTLVVTSAFDLDVYIFEIRLKNVRTKNPALELIQTIPVNYPLRVALSSKGNRLMVSASGTSDEFRGKVTFYDRVPVIQTANEGHYYQGEGYYSFQQIGDAVEGIDEGELGVVAFMFEKKRC